MKKETHIVIRVTLEERWLWKQVAAEKGETLSEWVRGILSRKAEKARKGNKAGKP